MKLQGSFSPPGDKSISHRIGLLSLLAAGACRVSNYAPGQDCASTLAAVEALGGSVRRQNGELWLEGMGGRLKEQAYLDCGNSGTTMRLLMGLLAGVRGRFTLSGDESLSRRPMERVAAPLRRMGAAVECRDGRPPVRVIGGGLKGIAYHLPVASAQLKSAVLLAGLRAAGATTVLEPAPSRDHTERLLALCGADITGEAGIWRLEPSELTLPAALRVPGDASSAAFFLCAAAIIPGSEVTAEGVLLNPTRTGFLSVLARMGARVQVEEQGAEPEPWGRVRAAYSPELTGCRVTAGEIGLLVDEVPVLALAATQARGVAVFEQVGELRLKETDRLAALVSQLGALGARLRVRGEDLVVEGPTPLRAPEDLDSLGDHRMAMTLRLAGLLAGARPAIAGQECVAISYPGFAETLEALLS
ncbi:MAG: 3-phosphoshikimate 1-carboxyvinyltransferase [Desulfarculus sp.]|nr:MAG: 3-phosphoshikimate 1-carboxyvinyltransferase [Desulfarculus sp.]